MDLVLVTESYPFAGAMEQTFLEPELDVLRTRFRTIFLVPQSLTGKRMAAPGDPVVRTDYAESIATRAAKLRYTPGALTLGLLGTELRQRPSLLIEPRAIGRLGQFLLGAAAMTRWVRRFVAERPAAERDSVFYSWWADSSTMGLGLAKRTLPGLMVVSRAHSVDLYPERHTPPYLPCRNALYRSLNRLFPDSDRGAAYVRAAFPWLAERCVPARQGVADPGFQTEPSTDGVFRVVSCSLIIPRKRVELLVRGLSEAATRRPAQLIEWTHIGDGPLRGAVERELAASGQSNLSGRVLGTLPPEQMMSLYRTQPIDLFVNLSDNEGTPVSLMEAASCGMPILATAVGGNVEVVTDDVGILLTENPTPDEIAQSLLRLLDSPHERARLRAGARQQWETRYDSTTNYEHFADELVALRAPQ